MLKKIGIAVGALIVIFLVVVATRPATFKIERSLAVAAPPGTVFALVNDFHKWNDWSPWEKLDPAMKKTFSGAESGVGAVYAWVGNDDVGEGRMTLVESKPAESLLIKLEFIKPFAATNDTIFTFKPEGAGTTVTWTMAGNNDFMGKAFSMFMDMDSMIGADFVKGLNGIKGLAEAEVKKAAEAAAAPPPAAPAAPEAAAEAPPKP